MDGSGVDGSGTIPMSALAAVTMGSAPRVSHGRPRASFMAATLAIKDMAPWRRPRRVQGSTRHV
eukprot:612024-Prymnesium_polylepis.1